MTLKYINENAMLQRFPVELIDQLKSVGWEEFAKYRSRLTGTDKYAQVHLMRALGSDNALRQFGIVYAYDFQKPTFNDERVIPYQSQLAVLGVADGEVKRFDFPSGRVLPDTVEIQNNGVVVDSSTYTVDESGAFVTFKDAPVSGVLKSTHKLSTKAYEPTNTFGIFLFDQVSMARTVETETLVADGTNKFKFANKGVLATSVEIKSGGMTLDALDYTLDAANGTVTFKNTVTAPTAKYAYNIAPIEGNDYGDLIVDSVTATANLNTADDLANLAYRAVKLTKPSPLTMFTLTNAENYDATVQRDTFINYWGSINRDRLILHFRTYPAHNAGGYYHVPLYLGRVVNNGNKPRQNTVLIGGCHTGKAFSYAANKKLGGVTVDYGVDTTNGNNFPLLHQSIGGMYYQKHHLSFVTQAKETELPGAGQGPSAYDGLYHDSLLFIDHKYDRTIGHLDDVYAVHPMGINQNAELELKNTYVKRHIGTGDGITKVFHLDHHAKAKPIVEVDCVEKEFTYDDDYKTITFAAAPAKGARICASYEAHNMHIFNTSDAPVTPTQLSPATPFVGIGWGVFQKHI